MKIDAANLHFQDLNEQIRGCTDAKVEVKHCLGQRYIGSGLSAPDITIEGTPGNALGAYLDGSRITVLGNAQDATGDTMNDGAIYIHGSSGDATGYAMRGGRIFVQGSAGYRAGIHMKAYKDKVPVIVVGGSTGSFLGEYQAGGTIIVLGLGLGGKVPVGRFCGTGMHGGQIVLRCDHLPDDLPKQVVARVATEEDLASLSGHIQEFCREFGENFEEIMGQQFFVLAPDTKNPYKQLYTAN